MLIDLQQGNASLCVSTVGATILRWSVGGTQLIDGYLDESELLTLDGYRSAVLVPWPNRIADGKWNDDGIIRSLSDAGNLHPQALHGLVFLRDFVVSEVEQSRIRLETVIDPTLGYPYRINVSVIYELVDTSLYVSIECINTENRSVPIGIGWHPYFFRSSQVGEYYINGSNRIDVDDFLIPRDNPFVPFSGFGNSIPDSWDYAITGIEPKINFPVRGGQITMEANIASEKLGVGVWHVYSGSALERGALQSVAVEPCTVMADSLNCLRHEISVPPRASRVLSVCASYRTD